MRSTGYVAHSLLEALRWHVEGCGGDEAGTHPGETLELTLLAPEATLMLGEGNDPADWPDHWHVEGVDPGRRTATAPCAE